MKRSDGNLKKILPIQIGIGLVLVLLLVLLFFWLKGDFIGYRPKEETVQFAYGNKINNSDKVEFSYENGILHSKEGDDESTLLNEPLLYENDLNKKNDENSSTEERKEIKKNKLDHMTITSDMMYSNPEFEKDPYRLPYFTDLSYGSGMTTISYDNKSTNVVGGYLYDGDDLYIFLEDTTLAIGDKKVELGPLSYARVHYRNMMEYYNSIDGDYQFMAQQDLTVKAYVADKYVIDLGTDVIEKDDDSYLIFTSVGKLDVIPFD